MPSGWGFSRVLDRCQPLLLHVEDRDMRQMLRTHPFVTMIQVDLILLHKSELAIHRAQVLDLLQTEAEVLGFEGGAGAEQEPSDVLPRNDESMLDFDVTWTFRRDQLLEGLANAIDLLNGTVVGAEIQIRIWRVSADAIPRGEARRRWLFDWWKRVDDFVDGAG